MKKLLITGFDPFGGEPINPSWEAVKRLPDRIGDYEIVKMQLPTVFGKAASILLDRAREEKPDVIVSVGQAGGRPAVTPEFVGINQRVARIPDNEGNTPMDQKICEDGPDGLFATVPVRAMVDAMTQAGYPASVSYTAGAYVCNDVLYTLLHHFSGTATRCGFIHVPFLPSQAKNGQPSLELESIIHALEAAISVL